MCPWYLQVVCGVIGWIEVGGGADRAAGVARL